MNKRSVYFILFLIYYQFMALLRVVTEIYSQRTLSKQRSMKPLKHRHLSLNRYHWNTMLSPSRWLMKFRLQDLNFRD